MRVFHVTPDDGHIVCQVQVRLAPMPPVLCAAPPEPAPGPALLVVSIVPVDQALLASCGHEYVH